MNFNETAVFIRNSLPGNYISICNAVEQLIKTVRAAQDALSLLLARVSTEGQYDTAQEILEVHKQISQYVRLMQDVIRDKPESLPGMAEAVQDIAAVVHIPETAEQVKQTETAEQAEQDEAAGASVQAETAEQPGKAYALSDIMPQYAKPCAFSIDGQIYRVNSWRGLLTQLCDILNTRNSGRMQELVKDCAMRRVKTIHIIRNNKAVKRYGRIGDTDLWIDTKHVGSDKVQGVILRLLKYFGLPEQCFVLYLADDKTEQAETVQNAHVQTETVHSTPVQAETAYESTAAREKFDPTLDEHESALKQPESDKAGEGYVISDAPTKYRKPYAFSFSGQIYNVNSWKSMFEQFCNILYSKNSNRMRELFWDCEAGKVSCLHMSGNMNTLRQPVRLGSTGMYIDSHGSAEDIKNRMMMLLKKFNLPEQCVKIYLSEEVSQPRKQW